ncbi:hypothetical protein TraAM80_05305 [Trypanosoma rangeli]|uniref:Uncharacterized protein n=1 Tax=Trypanosoma rangeli TaxID=5698 RepID=A0A3R7KA42_TRYRA|nr:uncharacterized protein TraAM80_05305 [Trypanosoma rangeli]RNF04153.1 hypothetical protein TraAM80_05305 [Trypanosoma rangeli]|eukprot:RNF04153.1 hypothetical protein TraAM80_05305 [Trypanosoma rangeli]
MSAGDQADETLVRPLPVWLRDVIPSDSSAELPVTEGSALRDKSGDAPINGAGSVASEAFTHILAELRKQSVYMNEMRRALAKKEAYQTCFDVLTMVGVVVDAVCEGTMTHVRSTVEYTGLLSTVTLSFVSGELSIVVEEAEKDVNFSGMSFNGSCILGCHLAVGARGCRVIINVDPEKITDVTQLTLTARSEEKTRELYQALAALRGCDSSNSSLCLPTPPSPPRAGLTPALIPVDDCVLVPQPSAAQREVDMNSQSHLHVDYTPTMRYWRKPPLPQAETLLRGSVLVQNPSHGE